ncbi:MAG TPA: STT3 domain-containing protein [Candidatus Bathyarchaeia archaeon]|nr:STT3 domain-containing protein [Candidatus Bathyarchaeia archaeon]
MELRKVLSRERFSNGLRSLGKLRIKTSHGAILTISALLLIAFVAFTIRILPLRWEIQSGALHLSEFDPYYQFSLTKYMSDNGLISPYWPTKWVDTQRWYPDGINMGISYPALPFTTALLFDAARILGFNFDLMAFCSLIPAIMGTIAVMIIYFLGKDIGGKPVGLLSALFLALNPSYIQRTSLGFFDTEVVGVVSLLAFSFLFLRAIEDDRPITSTVKYSLGAAAALAYFVLGWGAAYYLIGLTVLFVLVLLLLKRYSRRLLLAYSLTFGLGLLVAVSTQTEVTPSYMISSAVLPVAGMFILLCMVEIVRNLTSARDKFMFAVAFLTIIIGGFVALSSLGFMGSIAGKFITVLNPFIRDTNPLVESVAEHRISAWGSIYYDLGIVILFFAVGLFFVARNLTTKNLFLLIFGITSVYFAASMVRLLILLAPAFAILASVGIIGISKPFVALLKEPPRLNVKKKFGLEHVGKEFSGVAIFLIFLVLMTNLAFAPQTGGVPKVYRQAYSPVTITAGSLSIVPNEPVREWLDMLQYVNNFQNSNIVVCSWWDYGYWLSLLGNVTTLADNATINATQIENIGFSFMANESNSLNMLKKYNVQYVLVFVTIDANGNWIDWAGGDNGKWTWMAKISGNAQDRLVRDGFIDQASSWQNETTFGSFSNTTNAWEWNDVGANSTVYKLMSYGRIAWASANGVTPTDAAYAQPKYFLEEFFSGGTLSQIDSQNKYGGLVPLVCLYKIDWQTYNQDYPST